MSNDSDHPATLPTVPEVREDRIRPWRAASLAEQREDVERIWAQGIAKAKRELGPFFDGWELAPDNEPKALLQLHPQVLRGEFGGFVGRDWACSHAASCCWLDDPSVSRLHLQWLRLDRLPDAATQVLFGYKRGSIAVRDLTGGSTRIPGEAGAVGELRRAWRIVPPGSVLVLGRAERTYLWEPRSDADDVPFRMPTTAQIQVAPAVSVFVLWGDSGPRVAIATARSGQVKHHVLPKRQAEIAYWLAIRARRFIEGDADSPLVSAQFLRDEMFEDYDSDGGKKLSRAMDRLQKNLRTFLGVPYPIQLGAGAYGFAEELHAGCQIDDPAQGFEDAGPRRVLEA